MKSILFVSLLAVALVAAAAEGAAGQEAAQGNKSETALTDRERQAREELNLAAVAYRAGKFAEAQRHAERALELDASNKDATFFVARTIHAQYSPGIETLENITRAREAIAAYQRILQREPTNEESYKAVAALYGAIKEEELQRAWILQRASNAAISNDGRSQAYTVLASKDWNCSYAITEQPENKQTVINDGKPNIRYRRPKDEDQFLAAQQCAMRGLEMAEMAINLSPQNDTAWSFKANLLIEMAKLAEVSGQSELKAQYEMQADEAQKRVKELSEENQAKVEAADAEKYRATQTTTSTTISGGILNGRAISLPKPDYPSAARNVRGRVTLQVLIDEDGYVFKAHAFSGDPLLQESAVAAALQAKFSPTILSGQPVRVTGVITYNFAP